MSRTLDRAVAFFDTLDTLIGPRTPTHETGDTDDADMRQLQEVTPERR